MALSRGVTIQEPQGQVGASMASSSRAVPEWQPTYELDGKPLPANAGIRAWEKGEGGRVAQSLAHGLLLPEDVSSFAEAPDDYMGRRLQWHTIAVTFLHFFLCLLSPLPCI